MKQLFPLGLKFRQYEADLAKNRQNLKEPGEKGYRIDRYVVGVSERHDEISFQIIFNDGTRTKADESGFRDPE